MTDKIQTIGEMLGENMSDKDVRHDVPPPIVDDGSVIIKLPRELYDVLLGGAFEMVEMGGEWFAALPEIEQRLMRKLVEQHKGDKPKYLTQMRDEATAARFATSMPGAKQDDRPSIQFTPELARKLRKQYHDAVTNSRESFVFVVDEGEDKQRRPYTLLTSYAKYVLENLTNIGMLKPDGRNTQ